MKFRALSLLFTLLCCFGTAFSIQTTDSQNNYNFTATLDSYDATADCATHLCLKDLTTGAPTQGFKQVEMSKSGIDVYGLGVDGYIYHLNTAPMFQTPAAPVAWVKLTGLGHTAAFSIAVQDSATIYALGSGSGCATGSRVIEKANAALTGWNSLNPVHCSTSLSVASDGTLVSIDASTTLLTYRMPGSSTWVQAIGTGFTTSATVVNSTTAYSIKSINYGPPFGIVNVLYQTDLGTGSSASVGPNLPAGTTPFTTTAVWADVANNLWISSNTGQMWHQARPSTLALGAVGPVWNPIAGRANTSSLVGISGFNFTLSGTAISHVNTLGLSLSVSTSGAYPSCPVGIPCNIATHTVSTSASFAVGGWHAGGVSNSNIGCPTCNVGTASTEYTNNCDPLSADTGCQVGSASSTVICTAMGTVATFAGYPGYYFRFAYARFQGNSKVCVVDPKSGKEVCTYAVVPWCTPETTPPTLNTSTLPNEEDSVGFPVFFEAYGACFNLGIPGEPWSCRAVTTLPARINTMPRAVCTVLPIP